jgi:hypothetical protein
MKEIIKSEFSDKIKFNCKQCGNCCSGDAGYIWLTETEQQNIADYLKLDLKTFLKKYCIKVFDKISLKEIRKSKNNYWCIFLNSDMSCKIYPVRPHQCRTYPFWKKIVNSKEYIDYVLKDCPGTSVLP